MTRFSRPAILLRLEIKFNKETKFYLLILINRLYEIFDLAKKSRFESWKY